MKLFADVPSKMTTIMCVSGIWTRLTWLDFRLEPISGKDQDAHNKSGHYKWFIFARNKRGHKRQNNNHPATFTKVQYGYTL